MEYFDIILIAMIAGFILLRLRSELGTKTGGEPLPPTTPMPQNRQGDMYGGTAPDPVQDVVTEFEADPALRDGFSAIRKYDRNFSVVDFLDGAARAYEMILEAFWKGDVPTLETLLSDDVFGQFKGAIDGREQDGTRLDNRLLEIEKPEVKEASVTGKVAEITVAFTSELIAVTRDRDGNAIEGNLSEPVTVNDIWTFSKDLRSGDPKWTLVATRQG